MGKSRDSISQEVETTGELGTITYGEIEDLVRIRFSYAEWRAQQQAQGTIKENTDGKPTI